MKSLTLEVNKGAWDETRLVESTVPEKLAPDEVLLRIDRLALTANNISYAATGDSLGYWGFFPTGSDDWGRIPAMGWAEVVATSHPDVPVGERVWGWFPFSTHLAVVAGAVRPGGFSDVSPHRAAYAPVYAGFDRASANPIYETAREDQDSLLRGLYTTSWLVEDFLQMNDAFGAVTCLISSASSKTSIALAHCLKRRGALAPVGLTSERHVDFCSGLGVYREVLAYDRAATLDASEPVVLVDMAGNAELIAELHHHYADNMRHSCRIGATHYDKTGSVDGLPGARPEFFFAPTQIKLRSAETGPQALMAGIARDFAGFRESADAWLRITRNHGPVEVEAAYQKVLSGGADPATGQIISLHARS